MKMHSSMLLIAGLLVVTGAAAQSAEEQVEQRVLSFYQTLNDGEAEAWASHNAAQYHGNFARTGLVFNANRGTVEGIQTAFDDGLSYNLAVRQLDVTVYGNAAVATFYTIGPTNNADGSVLDGTFRVTQVWVREGQSWTMAHFHISPLESLALVN